MIDPEFKSRLESIAARIENLMDERDGIQSDIRDIYVEAKSAGYVPKVLRKAITRKRMDAGKRDEEDAMLELYEDALSPTLRKAVKMASEGASSRQIAGETGMDHATVARSVALKKESATRETADGSPPGAGSERAIRSSPSPATATEVETVLWDSAHAARLRAQIPVSTDPEWLEREADRLEIPAHLDRRQKAAAP